VGRAVHTQWCVRASLLALRTVTESCAEENVLRCMRDVKEVHTAVCRHYPSAFIVEGGGLCQCDYSSGPLEPGLWTTRNGTPDQKVAPAKGAVPQTSAQQLYVGPVAKITQFLTVVEAQQLSNK